MSATLQLGESWQCKVTLDTFLEIYQW
jgi:hypothetical protein